MSFKENKTAKSYLRCWLLPSLGFWMVLEALWGFYNPLSLPTQESEAMKHLWMKIDFISKEWYWIVLQSGVATINFLQSGHTWDQLRLSVLIQVPALTRCLLRESTVFGMWWLSNQDLSVILVFAQHMPLHVSGLQLWNLAVFLLFAPVLVLKLFYWAFHFLFWSGTKSISHCICSSALQWWFTPLWITLYRCTCTKKIFNAIFVYMWSFKSL